ncbi:MAG: enoyl-CoA hydratase [Candidatus Hydrogenedentes bacterium]|nr:enoyl-CoA hydratase [Candidatus Hydrogenedentota bacterium]
MDYQEIVFDVADYIATITLNRPDKLNAWTMCMESEYRHAMADAEQRDDVRVIIVTGAGRGFCAGADMSLLSGIQGGDIELDKAQEQEMAEPGAGPDVKEDFQKPYTFPLAVKKPIIAAINGHAMGLGLVHAVYCDIRFASDKAKFGTAFSQRGLIAEHGPVWMLPRLVGIENALDLLYSARIIDAEEAKSMGLVSRVVPHDELLDRVREYATHLATQCSPRALGIIKRQVYESLLTQLGPATDIAIREMFESISTEDFAEGISSFIEKRPPNFTGK